MRTIAIVNQKGGCGKTTTAINLAATYARRGQRTLLVDFDPQAHCAVGLGVPEQRIEYSIGDALLDDLSGSGDLSRLTWEVSRNLDLAPSTMMLAGIESPGGGLHRLPDRDRRLALLLDKLKDNYDRCLIDCPPTIGLLTFNALRAAREALIPVETGYFAYRGAAKQWKTIQRLIARIDRPIACHLLPSLHNPGSALSRSVLQRLRRDFAGQIMPVVVREHEELREAASFGQPVLEYAPQSEAQRDFEQLADWLEEHSVLPHAEMEVSTRPFPPAFSSGAPQATTPSLSASRVDLSTVASGGQPVPAPPAPQSELGGRAAELARRVFDMGRRVELRPVTEDENPPDRSGATERPAATRTPSAESRHPPHQPPAPGPSHPESTETTALVPMSQTPAAATATLERPAAPEWPSKTPTRALGVAYAMHELRRKTGRQPLEVAAPAPDHRVAIAEARQRLRPLFGARVTARGVLFVQPAEPNDRLSIAGDFNNWSSTATPLKYDARHGVAQAVANIPPGRYQYRLIANGQWKADPYQDRRQVNRYGEFNSVLVVPEQEPRT